MGKKAIVAYFKVVSRHLAGGTEESYEKPSEDRRSRCGDSNPGPSEHDAGVLIRLPQHSILYSLGNYKISHCFNYEHGPNMYQLN
jgi:hypothetical protein